MERGLFWVSLIMVGELDKTLGCLLSSYVDSNCADHIDGSEAEMSQSRAERWQGGRRASTRQPKRQEVLRAGCSSMMGLKVGVRKKLEEYKENMLELSYSG